MHLLFIKLHLIIFEVISLILFLSIFGALFYYSIVYKNYPSMKYENNILYTNISFSVNYSKGVYSDVNIKIFPQDIDFNYAQQKYANATILYSKANYEGKGTNEIIKEISDDNPYNILLFEDPKIAENYKHRLLGLKTETSSFNLNLLAQIHPEEYALSSGKDDKKNLYYNPVLSFLNPINVYYYIIFHLTIIIIIPLIFPNYIEYYITSYLSFMPNMYYSVYYARSLFGNDLLNKDNINLSNFIIHRDISNQKKLFMAHDFLNLNDYVPTNVNPYMINLLIMCGSIWLAQLFHPFDTQGTVKIVDVDLKKGRLKKYIKIFAIIAVFGIWGYFIIRGLIYELDLYYLFHRLLFNNFKRILDVKILIFIILFYYHIVFYVIMLIYTYQTYSKNKRYEGNQRIIYTWFR